MAMSIAEIAETEIKFRIPFLVEKFFINPPFYFVYTAQKWRRC